MRAVRAVPTGQLLREFSVATTGDCGGTAQLGGALLVGNSLRAGAIAAHTAAAAPRPAIGSGAALLVGYAICYSAF